MLVRLHRALRSRSWGTGAPAGTLAECCHGRQHDRLVGDTNTQGSQADLSITKTDASPTYTPGGSLTYTIVVSNAGPSDVTGATVTDTFPADLTNVAWTCAATGSASCTANGTGDISDTALVAPSRFGAPTG